jgi:hypothetical protein
LKSGTAPSDSDNDGMPDEWEKKFGFDPKEASENIQDKDKDGYANVEEYLNDTDPTVFVNYTKLGARSNSPTDSLKTTSIKGW